MKWVLISLGVVVGGAVLFYLGGLAYYSLVVNDRVTKELIENPQGERADIVMLMTFPDGQQLPMNYLREGSQVFAGADGRWWRAFREGNVPVTLLVKGEELSGKARVVLDDPAYKNDVFTRLRPNVPKWLPDWLNANLIEIDLDPANENKNRD